jgi:5-hydroxyisourate hydrolase-like protein (transthyretin family)
LDEAAIRGVLGADHLVLTFPLARSLTSSELLRVELLDVADAVLATAEQRITPVDVRRPVSVDLALPSAVRDAKGGEPLLLYRVRYALIAEPADRVEAAGTVAVAVVVPELFDLRVVQARYLLPGQSYAAHVQTVNPVTGHPVAGVAVSGVLTIGDSTDASPITARVTNTKGEAVLRYRTPASFASGDGELRVEARKGMQVRRLDVHLQLLRENRIVLNSDKRLYQPGQWFHARGRLVTWAKRAVAEAPVRFTLRSQNGEVVLRHQAVTNEFGIAAVDWQLPDTTRLGTFRLVAEELDREEEPVGIGDLFVEVRRYDLPNFTVTATPDRPYYLPGQNAELDVAAVYLFGKPVRRGSVKVVREEDRKWNYREQKWDTVDRDIRQGDLDADGHCRLRLDLSPAHEGLKEREYRRYQDITYAAFVTDASTGRTEQRRIRVRVSRNSLHLYVTGARLVDGIGDFYLTACYPDGSPAAVDVRVGLASREGSETGTLRVVRTNRYGAAKVTGLALDREAEGVNLVLQARDRTGRNVRWDERPWWRRQRLRVSTDKTLYRPGESMTVAIRSALEGPALVAVAQGVRPGIWSTRVQLRRGTTTVPIPGRPLFQGQLGVWRIC